MAKRNELVARHLTERTTVLEPGIYTADSNTDGYGSLMAALDIGAARFLGEEYLDGGVKSIAVEVGERFREPSVKRNPVEDGFEARKVRIGDDFYTRALREYDPPLLMWFRETYQNSVDAGAKHNSPSGRLTVIETTIEDQPDGTQIVSVTDNSGGMTLDTLENKFLTIAETGKKGDPGGVGGFGIAKELIVFPWLSYEIHTQDVLAKGYRADYGVKKVPFLNGTKVTVRLPADRKTSKADAVAVIERSYLPYCRFRVNGESISAGLRADTDNEVDGFSGTGNDSKKRMSLYYSKRARKQTGFFVRKVVCTPGGEECGALFMFEKSVDTQTVPGLLLLEITGSSLETLIANRMGLLSPYSWQLESYLRSLARDAQTATRKKKNALHKKWTGAGKMKVKAEAAGELAAIMHQFTGASQKFDDANNLDNIKKALEKHNEERAKEEEEEHTPPTGGVEGPQSGSDDTADGDDDDEEPSAPQKPIYTTPADMVDVIKKLFAAQSGLPNAIECAIKHLAHECDFYIHNEIENFRVPKKFQPTNDAGVPTMSSTLRKISRFWGECCRAILIAAGKTWREYGIGWIFDTEFRDGEYRTTRGEYIRSGNESWLLLNPFRGGLMGEGAKLYSLRKDEDLDAIFAIAVHECAHLIYSNSGHDEGYAITLTDLIANSRQVGEELKTIRNIVTKRPPGWKPAGRPKAMARFMDDVEVAIRRMFNELKRDGSASMRTSGGYYYFVKRSYVYTGPGYSYGFEERTPGYSTANMGQVVVNQYVTDNADVSKQIERAFREALAARQPAWVRKTADVSGEDVKEFLDAIEKQLSDEFASETDRSRASKVMPDGEDMHIRIESQWHNTKLPWRMRIEKSYRTLWAGEIKGKTPEQDDWINKTVKSAMRTIGPVVAEALSK